MLHLETVLYNKVEDLTPIPTSLLVFKRTIDEEEYHHVVGLLRPLSAILGWDPREPYALSVRADRARAHYPRVGTIYPGDELGFFIWAVDRGYSPIVMLPERKTTQRRLLDLHANGYLSRPSHIHLVGDAALGVTPSTFPSIVFSQGVAW